MVVPKSMQTVNGGAASRNGIQNVKPLVLISACGGQQMLHRNTLKHCVLPFNNFTDISEEWQRLKQLS